MTAVAGYLDPRPDRKTISRAYSTYFTHQQSGESTDASHFAILRRRVANAYLNHRYGTSFPNPLPGEYQIARLFPRSRVFLDISIARNLSVPAVSGDRLLDVGCGNGTFLKFAMNLGWVAEGIEPDPLAVAAALAAGCTVTEGSLDSVRLADGAYQQVTLSHVIEHVHDPRRLLHQCWRLLSPGGRLWLQTPSMDGFGRKVFGPAWRGLEPPRHLVLFNRQSLSRALYECGFERLEFHQHPGVTAYMWEQSRMIAKKAAISGSRHMERVLRSWIGAQFAEIAAALYPYESEFITCTAFRPHSPERA